MAQTDNYLGWLAARTPTSWWNDSGDPDDLRRSLEHGATGVTTNPVLAAATLRSNPEKWAEVLEGLDPSLTGQQRAEHLLRGVVTQAASLFEPEFRRSAGAEGYVCAQVNPLHAADRDAMIGAARRLHAWAPNIAVKLPATAAGLDALEECVAEGITITSTVNYTVPQVLAAAESHRRGSERARAAGTKPGRCFSVIMIGRIDDYLRDVAQDNASGISEEDIIAAGVAVTRRAYSIYRERGYEAVLLVAALRGIHHMTPLAGAELIMSIHPRQQEMLLAPEVPRDAAGIETPLDARRIGRLSKMPEFLRAYEPEGMKPEEFITFGVTQRTLAEFAYNGYRLLETLEWTPSD